MLSISCHCQERESRQLRYEYARKRQDGLALSKYVLLF